MKLRVLVWNEYIVEKENPEVAEVYSEGIHVTIAEFLEKAGFEVTTATLSDPEQGFSKEVLDKTDVIVMWSHIANEKLEDSIVERVYEKIVRDGLGFIVLHSAKNSKVFRKLMGTSCKVKWREAGEKERIWVVAPWHPIAEGIGDYFELEHTEMYGEPFDIPPPDELVFISWFQGGEVFRSGCCFYRGKGKIFYFKPGHETYPIYYDKNVQKVLVNAVKWAAPVKRPEPIYGKVKPLESL
ncbi:MAG: trehalose utilization protein ThuA [Thermoprotei archaeon]|nr:MAG: trehalose utilization protein ThuA [Thermoprotei archaeon]